MKDKFYLHKAPQEEIDKLLDDKKTWQHVLDTYKQPDWCDHFDALDAIFGCCWLLDVFDDGPRTKISEDFCNDCPSFNQQLKT
jgi:hypothetical protein